MADEQITVIGQDTHIKGEMAFDRTARILGGFEGRITSKGEVQVGHTATCKATIEAEHVVVDGAVEGDVTARDKITLNANANIQGDLTATTLVVAEGATFHGQCRVGPQAAATTAATQAATEPNLEPKPAARPTPTTTTTTTPTASAKPADSTASKTDLPPRPDWAGKDKTTAIAG